nr:GGDEF domain-containing protein [Lachnospiraceae bacterium]
TNRKEKTGKDGEHYLRIEDHVKESSDTHPKLWEAWDTGEVPQGYDTIDEVPRNTYVFYAPLVTDGRKLGVIGTEISIGALNYPILQTTLRQLLVIAIVLIVVVAILLWFIDRFYIKRLERINDSIRIYSKDKNARIAGEIDKNDTGNDEISSLANQTAAMISEIDTYMTDLVKNAKEENGNSEQTAAMNELAIRDSLTGIRNKAAYDKEIKSLEWGLDSGEKKFGIAIVDMNSLGAINEAGGREKGDIAIRRLCRSVCVTFAHSPVFRTDGDEFAIILRDNDYNMIEELTEKLYADIGQGLNGRDADKHEGFTAALGYALFDEDKDNSVDDVIRRAYEAMNERKAVMKQL